MDIYYDIIAGSMTYRYYYDMITFISYRKYKIVMRVFIVMII